MRLSGKPSLRTPWILRQRAPERRNQAWTSKRSSRTCDAVASYKLLVKRSAAKEIETLPRRDRQRIITRIRALASTPRPSACEKLTGYELYRVRQGNYR